MTNSFFKITAADKKTKARRGTLLTSHGQVETPVFVPVGTQGTVKSLTSDDLNTIGVQMFLANTYHLYLRPGADTVKKLGGLHGFAGWNKPLMTDSGGFQVFSLGNRGYFSEAANNFFGFRFSRDQLLKYDSTFSRSQRKSSKIGQLPNTPLVKVDDYGVDFRSHLDGSLHRFTPEASIEIQQKLGADIILAFDQCPPYEASKSEVQKAMSRTHDWALRSLKAFQIGAGARVAHQGKSSKSDGLPVSIPQSASQALFGIVQGGVFEDLRKESAKFIGSLSFDGVAIGGVAVGESKKEMYQVLDWVMPKLPDEKPRHLLGVGEIDDLFEAVERGVDMFDCVMPTRLGRMGHILTKKDKNLKYSFDITKSLFANDPRPPVENCECYTCQNYSRAYINHLFRARELLAYRLATYHNLWFITDLMRKIQEAISDGNFTELKRKWL